MIRVCENVKSNLSETKYDGFECSLSCDSLVELSAQDKRILLIAYPEYSNLDHILHEIGCSHNMTIMQESLCTDAASFELPSWLLKTCISEAKNCIDLSVARREESNGKSRNLDNFAILRGKLDFVDMCQTVTVHHNFFLISTTEYRNACCSYLCPIVDSNLAD